MTASAPTVCAAALAVLPSSPLQTLAERSDGKRRHGRHLGTKHSAKDTILQAASLLREQIDSQAAPGVIDKAGRLLAWQARKVREYVDGHIAGPIRVADLCALIQRSEAHFSRAF